MRHSQRAGKGILLWACAGALSVCGQAGRARAADFLVDAETIGQAYTLRDFGGANESGILNLQRLTQYLGLEGWNLVPARDRYRKYGRWQLLVSVRYDTDVGSFFSQNIDGLTVEQAIPQLQRNRVELLYGYLEGRDVGGVLDVRLGRQVTADLMDWFALDGGDAVLHAPWHAALEGFAGWEVLGSSPIATPNFQLDGTSFGHYGQAPVFTYGAALESWDLRWLTARVAYRHASSGTDDAGVYTLNPSAYASPAPGSGVNQELLTAELRGRFFDGDVTPWLGVRDNLLLDTLDDVEGGIRVAYRGTHAVSLDFLHLSPSFDGDSIFNVFPVQPYTDYRATYDVWPGRGALRGYVRGYLRSFTALEGATQGPVDTLAAGAQAGASFRDRHGFLRLDGNYESGYGGLDTGVDLAGRYLWSGTLAAEGRLTWLYANDRQEITNLRIATQSFGAQAGGSWRFADGLMLRLLFEYNANAFYEAELRGIVILDLASWI